jgi:hypothetical protein
MVDFMAHLWSFGEVRFFALEERSKPEPKEVSTRTVFEISRFGFWIGITFTQHHEKHFTNSSSSVPSNQSSH